MSHSTAPCRATQMEKTKGDVKRRPWRPPGRPARSESTAAIGRSAGMRDDDAVAAKRLGEGLGKFHAGARQLEQYARTRVTQKAAG